MRTHPRPARSTGEWQTGDRIRDGGPWPVVVWGAPLGSWAAHHVREATLVGFVAFLAAVEVATTFALVDEIRDNRAILGYLVAGLIVLPTTLFSLRRHRQLVFAAPGAPSR